MPEPATGPGPQGPRAGAPEGQGLGAFALLSATYFVSLGVFNPYAPLWFQSLGFSTLAIGTIASLQAWTRVFAPYGWAWLGDHGVRRVVLIRIAAAGSLCSALALLGLTSLWPVAAATCLMFVANAGVVPLYEATLAQALGQGDPRAYAKRYGRIRVWGSVGFVVAVTALGALLQLTGMGGFPAFVVAANALLLVAALRLPRQAAAAVHAEPAPAVLPVLRRPEVLWFFASIFFTVLAHTSLYTFFSLYLTDLGYPKSAIGALWAVAVCVEIVFFWFQGRFFHRIDPQRWLRSAAAVTALRFAVVAAAGATPWVLVAAQCTHAVTFAGHHMACLQTLNRHFGGRLRGRGQALYTTLGYGLSGVIGGVGGGWLIEWLGYSAVFWAASACGGLAWVCVARSQRAERQA
ncbi:MAG: MFS transporter [Rubrivivax sp.]|nr:MFS transporter [Rubrivivax sp.]